MQLFKKRGIRFCFRKYDCTNLEGDKGLWRVALAADGSGATTDIKITLQYSSM